MTHDIRRLLPQRTRLRREIQRIRAAINKLEEQLEEKEKLLAQVEGVSLHHGVPMKCEALDSKGSPVRISVAGRPNDLVYITQIPDGWCVTGTLAAHQEIFTVGVYTSRASAIRGARKFLARETGHDTGRNQTIHQGNAEC